MILIYITGGIYKSSIILYFIFFILLIITPLFLVLGFTRFESLKEPCLK